RSRGYRWIARRHAPRWGHPAVAAMSAALFGLILTLAPGPRTASVDLATTLRAQSAMEQWRRQPDAATASRASALLSRAGAGTGGAPSLLAMKAELELGSEWRWSAAERDYARALDIDPRNADARL